MLSGRSINTEGLNNCWNIAINAKKITSLFKPCNEMHPLPRLLLLSEVDYQLFLLDHKKSTTNFLREEKEKAHSNLHSDWQA